MNLTPPPATTPSFERSAIPLLLALKSSRIYLAAIVIAHALAGVAMILAAINSWVQAGVIFLVAVSLWFNIHHHRKPVQLVWRAGNRWFTEGANGSTETAKLTAIDFFSRWLVIISLRSENQRTQRHVIVFDALSEDTFRLFRVRLRIEGFALLNQNEDKHA